VTLSCRVVKAAADDANVQGMTATEGSARESKFNDLKVPAFRAYRSDGTTTGIFRDRSPKKGSIDVP